MNAYELYTKLAESKTGQDKLQKIAGIIATKQVGREAPAEKFILSLAAYELPPGTVAKAVRFAGIKRDKLRRMANAFWPMADILPTVLNHLDAYESRQPVTPEGVLLEMERQARDAHRFELDDHLDGNTPAAMLERFGDDYLDDNGDGLLPEDMAGLSAVVDGTGPTPEEKLDGAPAGDPPKPAAKPKK